MGLVLFHCYRWLHSELQIKLQYKVPWRMGYDVVWMKGGPFFYFFWTVVVAVVTVVFVTIVCYKLLTGKEFLEAQ